MRQFILVLALPFAACTSLELREGLSSPPDAQLVRAAQLCKDHVISLESPTIPRSVLASMGKISGPGIWSVVVKYDLDGTGVPKSIRLDEYSPTPALNEFVLEAVRTSKFKANGIATGCVYYYRNEISIAQR